jgi:hypothetical protein
MKKILIRYSAPLLLAGIFFSCSKNTVDNAPYTSYGLDTTQGQLKFIYASAYQANPTVIIKINGKAVSNSITGRTPFPGGGYNTAGSNYALYLSVPKGNDTITIVRPKTGTSDDSVVLYKTVINVPDNKPRTLLIGDTLTATENKTASVLINNDLSPLDTGRVRFRFVNLIPNVAAIDLYLNGVKVDSNIAYKQAGNLFVLRTGINAPGVTDPNNLPTPTWTIRAAGSAPTSTALASYASANTLLSQRVYTIFTMGYQGAASPRQPYVSFTLDKNN